MKTTFVSHFAAVALLALLSACASAPPPPVLMQLRGAPPGPVHAQAGAQVLQLMLPVVLPEALQRDSVLLPVGQAGLQALPGHRWAEPLADALPRLLRQDLAALLGEARVWAAPLPSGVNVTHHLRVEVTQLLATADRSAVVLQARWTVADASGRSPPVVQSSQLSVSSASAEAEALVAAHRLALWRLAEQVAAALR